MRDPAEPLLTIRLFGPLEVCLNGRPLPRLRFRKSPWLLALLALRHGTPVEREWLLGLLWPESPGSQALRNSLTDLRRALGEQASRLRTPTPYTLGLDLTGAAVDVVTFDQAMARGEPAALEAAVALYRGPLLEGCTEEWAFQERQGREQAYLAARERLAALAMERGKAGEAERHLRRAAAADPLREGTQRALMQVLAASGNYAAALHCYRELRLLLHRELNAEPDPETQTLFQQLRSEARRLSAKGSVARILGPGTGRQASDRGVAPAADRLAETRSLSIHDPPRHNLPAPLTSFIGREQAMAEVRQFLTTTRLLTLTGSGGCGKTRLALQVAAELREAYPDGVWLVELAALADPTLVPQTVAAALGLREAPDRPLLATLADYLRPQSLLLVLDNCEHLLPAGAQMAESLLRACPKLRILASSRAGLGIAGERTYRVPSLSLPPFEEGVGGRVKGVGSDKVGPAPPYTPHPTPYTLMQYEAVRLFVDRAEFVQPGFAVTEQNAAAVAQLCQRLDGIPLAIELAAARVRALSVAQLNERLDDMFRWLTGGSRTALPRHQTLRATIDWSYDLLSDAEQTLLRRLSVFSGGWTLAAAEGVGAGESVEAGEVLDRLTSLVDKSLVLYEERGGEGRYRLLETIRQYSQEKLERAEEVVAARDRHRDWYLAANERLKDLGLGPDYENLTAALEWSMQRGDAQAALRLGAALHGRWYGVSMREGRERFRKALSLPGAEAPTAARAWALNFSGYYALRLGDYPGARELLADGMAIGRQLGHEGSILFALHNSGNVAMLQGDYPGARALCEEKLAIARQLGRQDSICTGRHQLGILANLEGDYEGARQLLEESLAIYRQMGDGYLIGGALENLGDVARNQGDYQRARVLYQESLEIRRQGGNYSDAAWSLEGLAAVARAQGDTEGARALYQESLGIFRPAGEQRGVARVLEGLAGIAAHADQAERAARLFGAAEALRAAIASPLAPAERAEYDRYVAATHAALGMSEAGVAFAAAWAAGRAMTLEEAVRYALEAEPPPLG